jgi:hypothetical protein
MIIPCLVKQNFNKNIVIITWISGLTSRGKSEKIHAMLQPPPLVLDISHNISGMDTTSDMATTMNETHAVSTVKMKKQPVSWSAKEESFLVDCLFNAHDEGKQIVSGFKPEIWLPMVSHFVNELGPPENGPQKDVSSIKNKVNSLKQDWKVVWKLVSQSGWGWDEETGMVKAPPGVWDTYLQNPKNKSAKIFHQKPFPLYRQLTKLFTASTADGRDAFCAGTDSGTPSTSSTLLPFPQFDGDVDKDSSATNMRKHS